MGITVPHIWCVLTQSRRCPCPESAYKVACVVTALALVPSHACHWRADVCRDTQHCAQTRVHCLLTLVPMYCMHASVLFLYWHKCSEGFPGVLPLCAFMWMICTLSCVCVFGGISSCLLFTCFDVFLAQLVLSCSRAHGRNTVTQMNRLWNSLVHNEAA